MAAKSANLYARIEPWYSQGLRVMPVDNYLVFYLPDKEAGLVTITKARK